MNNSRILTIKISNFSGCNFNRNLNLKGDFQICSSVPLIRFYQVENIKFVTIFNSVANALGRMDIPLIDRKFRCHDVEGLI